jgi:hypothetical protein
MINEQRKKCNKYAIVHRNDRYRTVSDELATRERNLYGATIIHRNLSVSEATEWGEIYNRETPNDLSKLFTYDHSEELPQRGMDGITEYDIISAQCFDGIYRTGSVVRWNAETVIMEIGTVLWAAYVTTAGLVCKVDDANYGDDEPESWEVEFTEWLDELDNSYEVSTLAGMVA